jgi:hypothetical protein
VQRAPGIPRALCFLGGEFLHNSGASRRESAELRLQLLENCEAITYVVPAKRSASRDP